MPIYTCTCVQGSLPSDVKDGLAAEITRIHADINGVPPDYVNVVFTETPRRTSTSAATPALPC